MAEQLVEKAWMSLGGQKSLWPGDIVEFFTNFAPPAPRDVPDHERPRVEIASEAFLAVVGSAHCTLHGRSQEAIGVLKSGRLAALFADGETGAEQELQLQRRQLDQATSISDLNELVVVLQRQGA